MRRSDAVQFRKRGDASGDPEGAQLSEAIMSTYGVATRQDPSTMSGKANSAQQLCYNSSNMISAFSLLAMLLTLVWLIVFLRNKELRQEMGILSICAFFLAPVIITVKGGNPDVIAMRFSGIHFVDLLFAFSVAGLAGTFYHALFGKHYHRLPKLQHKKAVDGTLVQIWLIRLFVATLLFLWGVVFCVFAFDLAPAPAALATAIVMAVYIIIHRHDLLVDALLSALLMGVVTYITAAIALLGSPVDLTSSVIESHGYIGNVPVDILTWSVAFGLALGPLYEYIRRLAVK